MAYYNGGANTLLAMLAIYTLSLTTVQATAETNEQKIARIMKDRELNKLVAKGNLESCAYFIALGQIGYKFPARNVRRTITSVCKKQIEAYAYSVDPAYNKPVELCGLDECISLADLPPPTVGYSFILIDSVLKQYEEALANLKRY